MLTFQNFTTVYDVAEDRIRMTGVSATGEARCLWLTQRLTNMMIPRLCAVLEGSVAPQPVSNQEPDATSTPVKRLEQEFAQRRAQMAMRPAFPVSPPVGLDAILVSTVQFRIGRRAIAVRLSDALGSPVAEINLRYTQLRQWLAIVHRLYRQANWPLGAWPSWFAMAQIESGRPPAASLH